LDKHMAIMYANVVMGYIERGSHGVMAANREGRYVATEIPGKNLAARRVNPADYNSDRFRPNFESINGRYIPQSAGS